jgi:hypothetical protein
MAYKNNGRIPIAGRNMLVDLASIVFCWERGEKRLKE